LIQSELRRSKRRLLWTWVDIERAVNMRLNTLARLPKKSVVTG
jgi:hypothetical protein